MSIIGITQWLGFHGGNACWNPAGDANYPAKLRIAISKALLNGFPFPPGFVKFC